MIDEKGLCACMKDAYKNEGYRVTVMDGAVQIRTEAWAVLAPMGVLPRKALALLIEHIGCIPAENEAFQCDKGVGAQTLVAGMEQEVMERHQRMIALTETEAKLTALHYHDRQIWQAPERMNVTAVAPKYMRMIERKCLPEAKTNDDALVWEKENEQVIIYADLIDEEARKYLEGFQWVV